MTTGKVAVVAILKWISCWFKDWGGFDYSNLRNNEYKTIKRK